MISVCIVCVQASEWVSERASVHNVKNLYSGYYVFLILKQHRNYGYF